MKYNQLQVSSDKARKRVGRGTASGHGKTAGRGTKGQGARAGSKHAHGFMGGQGALMQRIPKARGFKSLRAPAQVVYLDQLNDVKATTIDNKALYEAGLIATPYHAVKIIARGEYKGKSAIKVQSASASVQSALKKAGASFEAVATPILPSSNPERASKRAERTEKAKKQSS